MRPGHALQRHLARDRIQRSPEADGSLSRDTVVGLIVMPGRHSAVARIFDEHVIVKEPRRIRLHQPCRDLRSARVEYERSKCGNPGPVAVVLEERRTAVLRSISALERTRIPHHLRYAFRQALHPVHKHAAQYDHGTPGHLQLTIIAKLAALLDRQHGIVIEYTIERKTVQP